MVLLATKHISSPWGHGGVEDLLDYGASGTKLEISLQIKAEKAAPRSGSLCDSSVMRSAPPPRAGQLPSTCLYLVKPWLLEPGGAEGRTEPGWQPGVGTELRDGRIKPGVTDVKLADGQRTHLGVGWGLLEPASGL